MRRTVLAVLTASLLSLGCTQVGSTPSSEISTSPSVASPSAALPSPSASEPASPSPSIAASADATDAASPAASGEGQVEVIGVEYAFENVPATTAAGTEFSFENEGSELHEMVVLRKNPGVTESFQELLALPEEEAFTKVTPVGGTLAAPGTTAPNTVTVSEPGEHIMLCFIPVGTTSASIDPNSPPTGEPHFVRGMLEEFVVE